MTKFSLANIAKWSSAHPAITIVVALLIAGGTAAGLSQATQGRITELFVPDDLPALDTQKKIEDIWGRSEGTFFLYLTDTPTDPALLRAVNDDIGALEALAFVQQTSNIIQIIESQHGPIEDLSNAQLQSAADNVSNGPLGDSVTAQDALLVRLEIDAGLDAVEVTDALNQVRDASAANADVRSAGLLYIEREQTDQAGGDVVILMPLSMAVVILVLSLLFRRVQDVAVPIITTLVAIAMAYGTVAWAGMALAPPSYIVMPLLLGLGIDYMMHIVYVYRELDTNRGVPDRFHEVGHRVGRPVFYTAVTTLIGFGSFLVSTIPQIRTWGLLIGSGALYAFLLGFTLLPALYRLKRAKSKPGRQPLSGILDRVADLLPRHRKKTLIVGAIVTALLGASIALLVVTPDVGFDQDSDSPAAQDLQEVQDRFGGQTIAQFLIPAGDRPALEAFEGKLDELELLGFVDGPQHRMERIGQPTAPYGGVTEGVATEDWWRVIVGYQQEDREEALDALEALGKSDMPEARLTGQDMLGRESDDQFLPNIGLSTGIALGLVIVLLGIVFQRPVAAMLAFMPIVITIIWQLGIQGLAQIPLNPITGVMTAMMIGVGVDYSIHMMVHFREQRRLGDTREEAAQHAIRSVGKPVLAATITTVFAFSVLGFSSLLPLRDFGRVAAIVVVCAFIVSITILPAVLALGSRNAARQREDLEFDAGIEDVEALPEVQPGPFVARSSVEPEIHPTFSDPNVQAWYDRESR